MVTNKEIIRYHIRELVNGNTLALYKAIQQTGDIEISIRRSQAIKYFASIMIAGGFGDRSIMAVLAIAEHDLLNIRRSGFTPTAGFRRALCLMRHPMALLQKSSEYAYDYIIRKTVVETLVIEDLVTVGFSNAQVHAATGFGLRRIQRIRKRLYEEECENE